METTEKIVEAYCRYFKGLFTIPNIKCEQQYEIDLLAVGLGNNEISKYHIETSVSISGNFSRLTNREFDLNLFNNRVNRPAQRRTIGFFIQRKFSPNAVLEKLRSYGFDNDYKKIIVTWGWEEGVLQVANENNIELWDFRNIIRELADSIRQNRKYFSDDTLRTLQLYVKAINILNN